VTRIDEVVALLREAGVPDEALVSVRPGGRVLGIPRADRWELVGRAWRLGEHLLCADGTVYRIGSVLRAVTPKDFNADKSAAAAAHRELQRQAAKAGFEGDVVNRDFERLDPDAADALVDRLAERARLRIDPF
jgi:hypothetical protein